MVFQNNPTLNLTKSNTAVVIANCLSIIVHLILIYLTPINFNECPNCKTESSRNIPINIKIETSKVKRPKELSESIEIARSENKVNRSEQNFVSPEEGLEIPMRKKHAPVTKSLDYQRLASSIKNTLKENESKRQSAFYDNCFTNNSISNDLDCPDSNNYHFNHSNNSSLSTVFKKAFTQTNKLTKSEKQTLLSQDRTLNKIVNNPELPNTVRDELQRELSHVRTKILLDDCNGKPNQGDCAGEVDLIKLITGIAKIIQKLDKS